MQVPAIFLAGCLAGWFQPPRCMIPAPVQNQNNNVQTVIVQQSTQLEVVLQNLIKLIVSCHPRQWRRGCDVAAPQLAVAGRL